MLDPNELKFEYAIQFPDGSFYTGRVNSPAEPNAWQGARHEAFTFTERGAYTKRDRLACFAGCTVVHIL